MVIQSKKHLIKRAWSALGPGVITGAADDDPSGIATYSIAGAQLGTSLLWTAWLTWPLMASVQMMCARIGMVTGRGLTAALRRKLPRPLLISASVALLAANTLNIGADLAAMADAAELLTGWNSHFFVIVFAVGISWVTVQLSYRHIAGILKWLVFALFAYVVTAFYVGPDWKSVLYDTFHPGMPRGSETWSALVAILGTTISPYLFFWQTAQEVEEEKCLGRLTPAQRRGASTDEVLDRVFDVGIGTFFSNVVMFFIILTTALTLNRHGITHIETSAQVAKALEPLAGRFAKLLYMLGLLGTGLLAIPTLTGSAAYALSETFAWRPGLDAKLRKAKPFYAVILLSTLVAVIFDFADFNPVKALYWSAVLNGLLAPFLLIGILMVASDEKLMQGQPSSILNRLVVALTTLIMFGAALGMFVFV